MKYRVQIDISFSTEKDATDFIDLVKTVKDKVQPALTSNAMPELTQPMSVGYHECRHDEDPPKPCSNYVTIDIKK